MDEIPQSFEPGVFQTREHINVTIAEVRICWFGPNYLALVSTGKR